MKEIIWPGALDIYFFSQKRRAVRPPNRTRLRITNNNKQPPAAACLLTTAELSRCVLLRKFRDSVVKEIIWPGALDKYFFSQKQRAVRPPNRT